VFCQTSRDSSRLRKLLNYRYLLGTIRVPGTRYGIDQQIVPFDYGNLIIICIVSFRFFYLNFLVG